MKNPAIASFLNDSLREPSASNRLCNASYEIMGAEELIYGGDGDDLDDVLGAYELIGRTARRPMSRRGVPPGMARTIQAAAVAKMANAGAVVREHGPTKTRRLYLPLGATPVVAAASANVTARPQTIAFKPEKLSVPATIAPDFTIDSILVGVVPQGVQTGSAPAESFLPTAVDSYLDCDTVQTSQDFVVGVTNISGATRTFRGTVFGRSASS